MRTDFQYLNDALHNMNTRGLIGDEMFKVLVELILSAEDLKVADERQAEVYRKAAEEPLGDYML